MSKHTPGPWSCADNEVRDEWGVVAIVVSVERRADARFIATAPDLFALLVESQTSIGGDWRKRRDALIAKATGGAT
jgi:RNA polymerase subunit RPABC4/transcription elongation factor Spt4